MTLARRGNTNNDTLLVARARAVAKSLTYNTKKEGDVKNLLLELTELLDAKLAAEVVDVHKKKDGYLIINGQGTARFMTFGERIMYCVFGVTPHFGKTRQ